VLRVTQCVIQVEPLCLNRVSHTIVRTYNFAAK